MIDLDQLGTPCDTAEEVDMQVKFAFFFPVISRLFFTEKPMVDP